MVWMGRIDPDTPKGLEDELEISRITGHQLEYVGFVENEKYYRDIIVPALHNQAVRREQFQTREEKYEFYNAAKVSLIPVKCEESFGLTYIESMMAGTPVITYARGAAPEIVKDGETGFLVNASAEDIRGEYITRHWGIEGLREAVNRLYSFSREEYEIMRTACKKYVKENFSMKRMADAYEKLYMEAVKKL